MLNRAVLIVRPKQPFLNRAAQFDDSGLVPDSTGEQTAYLVPEFEDDNKAPDEYSNGYSPRCSNASSSVGIPTKPRGRRIERSRCSESGSKLNYTLSSRIFVITKLSTTRPNLSLYDVVGESVEVLAIVEKEASSWLEKFGSPE
jgi:hypothetical protein